MQLDNKKRGKGKASKTLSENGREERRQGEKVKAKKLRKKATCIMGWQRTKGR